MSWKGIKGGVCALGLGALFLTGCASVTTPVLRHETGEALGQGRIRARASFGLERFTPFVPTGSTALDVTQDASAFKGLLFGAHGAYGITDKIDGNLGTYFTTEGAGWRIGGKYQILGNSSAGADFGNFAVAGMIGYGVHAGNAAGNFRDADGNITINHTLSSSNVDFGVPVSFRLSKVVALYGGVNFYINGVGGAVETTVISETLGDFGFNLGTKITVDNFEADVEIMILGVTSPFTQNSTFLSYWGVSAGFVF